MNWQGKSIKDLSDDELIDAIHTVGSIDNNRVDKLSQTKKRHKTIFEKHPPVENPAFTNLAIELSKQISLRNL